MKPLEGKHALVTGGGTGIGLASARKLAHHGARVTLLGSHNAQAGAATLVDEGLDADAVTVDLADPAAAKAWAEEYVQAERVDILVNNAGKIYREPAVTHDPDEWMRILNINLNSAWMLSQVFGRAMVERGEGRIISTASLLTFQGGINVVSYTSSKHAIAGMTKTLCNEWAGHGVTVNAVAPGYIATDNTAALRADAEREPAIRERIPAGRWGDPEDIAGAVAFLAGPDAAYVNGHVLVVDGGWMAR